MEVYLKLRLKMMAHYIHQNYKSIYNRFILRTKLNNLGPKNIGPFLIGGVLSGTNDK